jgi:hypothetical protein
MYCRRVEEPLTKALRSLEDANAACDQHETERAERDAAIKVALADISFKVKQELHTLKKQHAAVRAENEELRSKVTALEVREQNGQLVQMLTAMTGGQRGSGRVSNRRMLSLQAAEGGEAEAVAQVEGGQLQ